MKKRFLTLLIITFIIALTFNSYNASAVGLFYTEATYPAVATGVKSDKPISELKKGTSNTLNVLYLVETGDAGIKEAAENGNISQVHYVDMKIKTVLFFFQRITTTVYGE